MGGSGALAWPVGGLPGRSLLYRHGSLGATRRHRIGRKAKRGGRWGERELSAQRHTNNGIYCHRMGNTHLLAIAILPLSTKLFEVMYARLPARLSKASHSTAPL